MNRGELVLIVKEYLNRPNMSSEAIGSMIASVEGEMNRALREHPRNARRVTTTQAAGVSLLSLPTDIVQLVELRSPLGTMTQYPPTGRAQAEGDGNAFISYGDSVELLPAPAADTSYSLAYTAMLRPLVADADANWVSKYFPDLYLYGALKEAAVYLKDDQRLQLWQAEFLRRLDGVQAQGWNQNIAAGPRIVID